MLEILAPAGSMEALRGAVQNGANAVYLGCGMFNARQSAKNFTPEALAEAVKYCHIRGVHVHLTLNTLVSDREMNDLCKLIRHAALCGVDAFIVQDLGVVRQCKAIAPHIPIHGSTQMTVHSLPGVRLCAAWGLSRVVLSRELSREEIRYICANSPIEIEVFGHGALCMSYSGQCYLSAAIGGRSGNRGRCAQPCRQCYGYGRMQNSYPLSLKDNCLVQYLQELERMGVASVKLEGRMKRPEYVAAVTSVYVQAAKTGGVTRPMMETLYQAFNRQGFTAGYYQGRTGAEMFGVRQENQENNAWYKQVRQSYEAIENQLVPITMEAEIRREGCRLSVQDEQGRICTAYCGGAEEARTMPLTERVLEERLGKTGGTPYYCTDVRVTLQPGVTLPVSAINGLRRDALNMLTAQRARQETPILGKPQKTVSFPGQRKAPMLTVQVTSREQVTASLIKARPSMLYVPVHLLAEDLAWCEKLSHYVPVCAALPRITHDAEVGMLLQNLRRLKNAGVEDVLVCNLGQIIPAKEAGMRLHGDFGLNIYNSGSIYALRELEMASVCLSFEMTLPQIRDVSKAVACELLCYGRQPLMVTENCLIRGRTGKCTCQLAPTKLTDKTGAEFPVIRDGMSCRSVLLNGKKLNWLDRQEDLVKLGLWATRLYFTTENPREVDQVIGSYLSPRPFDPGANTRGLYLRGVE